MFCPSLLILAWQIPQYGKTDLRINLYLNMDMVCVDRVQADTNYTYISSLVFV